MIRFSMLALAVVSFCFVSPTLKADETREAVTVGVVKDVNADKGTFVLVINGPNAAPQEIPITIDKDTKFIDAEGKEAKMTDVVKEKALVKVTRNAEHKASKVEAVKAAGGLAPGSGN